MEPARQYNVHEAKTHLSRILQQVAAGDEVLICRAGQPVAKVVPLTSGAGHTGREPLEGQVHVPEDLDKLPDDIADSLGIL
ncbi:type II toxin-antitoxin system Phd/YefM family antitoxin [Streptomyces sp. NBC_00344]|uniref:type II toxin-antitoxin system Phd/YefM family antitoxin n=1 Tax=Streptomyces sp. NBC_00344 TaxID=2975720 RepID=UPI002E1F7DAF